MKLRTLLVPCIGLLLFIGLYVPTATFAPKLHADNDDTIIYYGDTVYGEVENRFGSEWYFFGWAGEPVSITLTSHEFDTYLELYGPLYRRWYRRNNNFEGMGTNSALLDYRLPNSGYYVIVVAPSARSATGSYTVTLEGIRMPPVDTSAE